MNKYLLIYHSPAEAMEKFQNMTQEEIEAEMAKWQAWKDACGDAVVDFGNPVGGQHIVTNSGSTEESDDTSGYGIIQAEDMDAAKDLLTNHPSLADDDGSSISVYEIHQM